MVIFHIYVSTIAGWWFSIFMLVPLLVGGIPTPLKNMSSSVGMIFHSQLNGKSFKIPWFQSPPTSYCFFNLTDISPLANWKNPMGASLYVICPYSAMDPPPTGLPKPRIGAAHSYLTAMAGHVGWFQSRGAMLRSLGMIDIFLGGRPTWSKCVIKKYPSGSRSTISTSASLGIQWLFYKLC